MDKRVGVVSKKVGKALARLWLGGDDPVLLIDAVGSRIRLQLGAGFATDSADLTIIGAGKAMRPEEGHPMDIDLLGIRTMRRCEHAGGRSSAARVTTSN